MGEFDVVVGQEAEPEGGGGCKTCGLSCLGILVLLLLVIGVMSANASARLDARFVEIGKEVQELQASADVRRGTVLGAPANDENGAVDYNGLEWVLTSGEGGSRRNSWEQARPPLPAGVDAMVKRVNPEDTEIDLILSSALLAEIDSDYGIKDTPQERARRKQAEAQFKRLRPVLRYVRDGLQRGKCDWETEWAKGMRFETPNLLAMRATANLMAYEASLQPPSEAIQTGLEIVAFGEDNARQGTLIGGMIGIAVSAIGFKSLAHTLGRPGIEPADCKRVIAVLERYRGPDMTELFRAERVGMIVSGLELSGRPLEPGGAEELGFDADTSTKGLQQLSIWHAHELEGYEHFMEREIEISTMPRGQRTAARQALREELEDSWYLFAKIAMPNLSAAQDNVIEAQALGQITRVLAAAHLLRLEEGAFPPTIQGLTKLLGKGVEDPCAAAPGTPLGYLVQGDRVWSWAAGSDQQDQGGPETWNDQGKSPAPQKGSDDRGLVTRAPSQK